jgi:hypothetical protein
MRDRLRKLARHDPGWSNAVTQALPRPHEWSLEALGRADAAGQHSALIAALRGCGEATRALSDEISRHLFSHVSAPERSIWQ